MQYLPPPPPPLPPPPLGTKAQRRFKLTVTLTSNTSITHLSQKYVTLNQQMIQNFIDNKKKKIPLYLHLPPLLNRDTGGVHRKRKIQMKSHERRQQKHADHLLFIINVTTFPRREAAERCHVTSESQITHVKVV